MGVTIYKVAREGDGKPVLFMVEGTTDGEPRRSANYIQELGLSSSGEMNAEAQGRLATIARSIQDELDTISVVASAMLDSMKKISPSEVMLEFGVELGGKCGLPLVTEGSAKANVKIQVKWQAGKIANVAP
jgi:hypothetical protein